MKLREENGYYITGDTLRLELLGASNQGDKKSGE
jgi:hypothetical protein